jgi:hypothetical protein
MGKLYRREGSETMTKKNDKKTKDYLDPKTKKFKVGNPGGGRPKGAGISITTEIKKKLEECPEGKRATYLTLLINRILKQAIQDGDQQMIGRIWNYVDGLPHQTTDVKLEVPLPILGGQSAIHSNKGDQKVIEAKKED